MIPKPILYQLTSKHIKHTVTYHVLSYHVMSFQIVWFHLMSNQINIKSMCYHAMFVLPISCHILACPFIYSEIISYHFVLVHVRFISFYIRPRLIIPWPIVSHHQVLSFRNCALALFHISYMVSPRVRLHLISCRVIISNPLASCRKGLQGFPS